MYYFTADEHIGHEKIIDYCNRPFKDMQEMEDTIVRNHNALVTDKDDVFHLGDITMMKDPSEYVQKLNGRHYLIRGNHDKRKLPDKLFVWVKDVHLLRYEKQKLYLSHYAHRVWPSSHHGTWHLFGHSHGESPERGLSLDVGVDAHNFKPLSFFDIKIKLDRKRVEGDSMHHIYQRLVGVK